MKLHQLVSGIASGYVTKGIQLVVSLIMVPFFLREEVLGLDGYGRAFTISALVGFLPLFTDGLSFALIRSVSRALDQSGGGAIAEVLGAGIKIMSASSGAVAGAMVALSAILLPLAGL